MLTRLQLLRLAREELKRIAEETARDYLNSPFRNKRDIAAGLLGIHDKLDWIKEEIEKELNDEDLAALEDSEE